MIRSKMVGARLHLRKGPGGQEAKWVGGRGGFQLEVNSQVLLGEVVREAPDGRPAPSVNN